MGFRSSLFVHFTVATTDNGEYPFFKMNYMSTVVTLTTNTNATVPSIVLLFVNQYCNISTTGSRKEQLQTAVLLISNGVVVLSPKHKKRCNFVDTRIFHRVFIKKGLLVVVSTESYRY
jgi:hypothetical protein